jgi:hypothetical protein
MHIFIQKMMLGDRFNLASSPPRDMLSRVASKKETNSVPIFTDQVGLIPKTTAPIETVPIIITERLITLSVDRIITPISTVSVCRFPPERALPSETRDVHHDEAVPRWEASAFGRKRTIVPAADMPSAVVVQRAQECASS